MWSRQLLINEMAASLWEVLSQRRGKAPRGAKQAAADLAQLYEQLNDTSLDDLATRIQRSAADADPAMVADTFVLLAIDSDIQHDELADIAYAAQVEIPIFAIDIERGAGGESALVWDGRAEVRNPVPVRNPASSGKRAIGPRLLLLEDEPILQAGTTRMLNKLFPGTPVIVDDNVEAAIADIKHHEITLIVSDVDVIGEQSGLDLFEWVKRNRPELVDRYVFFTGNTAAEAAHYRYLPKGGATRDDLKAAIMSPAPGRSSAPVHKAPPVNKVPSTASLAAVVRDALPKIEDTTGHDGRPNGRVGSERIGRKYFVSAVWAVSSRDPRMAGVTYEEFKRRLVDANRAGEIKLARADLVSAFDPTAVAGSEIVDRGATFHFVVSDVPEAHDASAGDMADPQSVAAVVKGVLSKIEDTTGPSGKPNARFGGKVFISAIWELASRDPRLASMSYSDFKKSLLAANRKGLLELRRADLVAAMDPDAVRASETMDRGAVFHFVYDPASPF